MKEMLLFNYCTVTGTMLEFGNCVQYIWLHKWCIHNNILIALVVTTLVEENLFNKIVYAKINLKMCLHTHVSCKQYTRLDQNLIQLQSFSSLHGTEIFVRRWCSFLASVWTPKVLYHTNDKGLLLNLDKAGKFRLHIVLSSLTVSV
jgi:hypothetical protein